MWLVDECWGDDEAAAAVAAADLEESTTALEDMVLSREGYIRANSRQFDDDDVDVDVDVEWLKIIITLLYHSDVSDG